MIDSNAYQTVLQAEKEKLEGELATVARRNPSNPMDWEPIPQGTGQEADPNDAADLIEGYEDNAGIVKELEIRYNQVLAALSRIEAGTYGVCTAGGEAIEEARLQADPAAATCVAHIS